MARDASAKTIPLLPPRELGTFLGLILIAPAALYLTVRLVALPHTLPVAATSWLVLAPFVLFAVHLLTRRLSVTPSGLEWRSRVRRPKVLPWKKVEVLRHELVAPGKEPAQVEVEVRAEGAGTLRLQLSPESFNLLRRELNNRCPGMVEVDGVAGHITVIGGGSTAAERSAKVARAAAAELPRQWANVVAGVALLGLSVVIAIAGLPSANAGAARLALVVVAGLVATVSVTFLAGVARTMRRLGAQVRWGRGRSTRE